MRIMFKVKKCFCVSENLLFVKCFKFYKKGYKFYSDKVFTHDLTLVPKTCLNELKLHT